jgi:hypothetical protein
MHSRRFETDQAFEQIQETQVQAMTLVDGAWYVRVIGDYAGRVSGAVYRTDNETNPERLDVQVGWALVGVR